LEDPRNTEPCAKWLERSREWSALRRDWGRAGDARTVLNRRLNELTRRMNRPRRLMDGAPEGEP